MKKEKIYALSLIVILLMVNTATAITGFTVDAVTPNLQFNGNRNSKWINASGVPEGTAWGNITNTGDTVQTFKVSIDTIITGITLLVNNVDSVTGRKQITAYPGTWPGSSNVPAGGSVKMYMRANFTNVVDNTYTNNLIVGNATGAGS